MAGVRTTITLPSGAISYLEFRPVDRPAATVVLLHGGGVDSASLSWGEAGPRLAAAGYRVIAPDHPGFGDSPLPCWPLTQRRLVAYVGELVDALELDRYAVGGLSMGGGMTIGHVLARPDRVTGVILVASYGMMPRLSDGPLAGVRQAVTWAMLRTGLIGALTRWVGGSRTAMAFSLAALIRDPARRTPLMAEVMAAAQHPGFAAFEQWQRDEVLWNRLRTDYTAQLATFPRRTLIIHGDRDDGVPVARARAAAEVIPDAELTIVAGAGHWVQRDRPDVAIPAIVDFLGLG